MEDDNDDGGLNLDEMRSLWKEFALGVAYNDLSNDFTHAMILKDTARARKILQGIDKLVARVTRPEFREKAQAAARELHGILNENSMVNLN